MKKSKNKYIKNIYSITSKDKIYRIVFMGDSISSAEWVHPNFREIIEYTLKQYIKENTWKIRCINSALNGGSTKDMIVYLDDYVLLYKPTLVILQGTRNDFTFGIDVEKHTKNLEKIISKIIANNINIVFCGTTPSLYKEKNNEYLPYIKKAPQITKKFDIKYIDLFNELQKYNLKKFFTYISKGNPDEGLKSGDLDFEHPNQLGNAFIAKILLKGIFDIEFDPELYIKDTNNGKMFPRY